MQSSLLDVSEFSRRQCRPCCTLPSLTPCYPSPAGRVDSYGIRRTHRSPVSFSVSDLVPWVYLRDDVRLLPSTPFRRPFWSDKYSFTDDSLLTYKVLTTEVSCLSFVWMIHVSDRPFVPIYFVYLGPSLSATCVPIC